MRLCLSIGLGRGCAGSPAGERLCGITGREAAVRDHWPGLSNAGGPATLDRLLGGAAAAVADRPVAVGERWRATLLVKEFQQCAM